MTNQKWTGNKQTKNPNKIDYKYFVRFTSFVYWERTIFRPGMTSYMLKNNHK